MTYTVIFLVSRKPGLSLQAFRNHWESVHVPLLKSIVGEDFPLAHTRHYVERDPDLPGYPAKAFAGGHEDFPFDVVALFTFANRGHYERFMTKAKQPENYMKLAEDDDKFKDCPKTRVVFVGETQSTARDGHDMGWRFIAGI